MNTKKLMVIFSFFISFFAHGMQEAFFAAPKKRQSTLEVAIFNDTATGAYLSGGRRLQLRYQEQSRVKNVLRYENPEEFGQQPRIGPIVREMIDAIHSGVDVVLVDTSLVKDIFNKSLLDGYMKVYQEQFPLAFFGGYNGGIGRNFDYIKKAKKILKRIGNGLRTYKIGPWGASKFVIFVSDEAMAKFGSLVGMGIKASALREIRRQDISAVSKREIGGFDFSNIFIQGSSAKKMVYLTGHGMYNKKLYSETDDEAVFGASSKAEVAGMTYFDYKRFLELLKRINCFYLHVSSCCAAGWNLIEMYKEFSDEFPCDLQTSPYMRLSFVVTVGCLTDCDVFSIFKTNLKYFFSLICDLFNRVDFSLERLRPEMFLRAFGSLCDQKICNIPHIAIPGQIGEIGLFRILNMLGHRAKVISAEHNAVSADDVIQVSFESVLLYPIILAKTLVIDRRVSKVISMIPGRSHTYIKEVVAPDFTVDSIADVFLDKEFSPFSKLVFIGRLICQDGIFLNFVIYKPAGEDVEPEVIALKFKAGRDEYELYVENEPVGLYCGPGDLSDRCKSLVQKWVEDTIPLDAALSEITGGVAGKKRFMAVIEHLQEKFNGVQEPQDEDDAPMAQDDKAPEFFVPVPLSVPVLVSKWKKIDADDDVSMLGDAFFAVAPSVQLPSKKRNRSVFEKGDAPIAFQPKRKRQKLS